MSRFAVRHEDGLVVTYFAHHTADADPAQELTRVPVAGASAADVAGRA